MARFFQECQGPRPVLKGKFRRRYHFQAGELPSPEPGPRRPLVCGCELCWEGSSGEPGAPSGTGLPSRRAPDPLLSLPSAALRSSWRLWPAEPPAPSPSWVFARKGAGRLVDSRNHGKSSFLGSAQDRRRAGDDFSNGEERNMGLCNRQFPSPGFSHRESGENVSTVLPGAAWQLSDC